MNAATILHYGNKEVETAVNSFPNDKVTLSGAVGTWSVKDILAHLTSYEYLLLEVLHWYKKDNVPTPRMDLMKESYEDFNTKEVASFADTSFDNVYKEYQETYQKVMDEIKTISPEELRQVGTIPWYGEEYSLDDYIVYASYGHKREHTAQIAAFKDVLTAKK